MQNKCITYSGVQVQFTLICTQIRWGELWRILLKIHNKINTLHHKTPPKKFQHNFRPHAFVLHGLWWCFPALPAPSSPSTTHCLPLPLLLLLVRAKFYQLILEWVIHTYGKCLWHEATSSASTHTHTHTDTYSEAYLTVAWPQTDAVHLIVAVHFEIVELSL